MSRDFHIVCHMTRQRVWIGQGHCAIEPPHRPDMEVFYTGHPEVMEQLGRFLRATLGKPLVVLDGEDVPHDYTEFP